MGLQTTERENAVYLSVAGGYIWNRKGDKNHPMYAEQEFNRADGTVGIRTGAKYPSLIGTITGVEFREHQQYGQSVNVTVEDDGDIFILSISTNNRYAQSMMKALLVMKHGELIEITPYDFEDSSKKRVNGISFKQGGQKLDLTVGNSPTKDASWYKTAPKKQIKRFFEDLNDWFVEEVQEKVVPQLEGAGTAKKELEVKKEPVAKKVAKAFEEAVEPEVEDSSEDIDLEAELAAAAGLTK